MIPSRFVLTVGDRLPSFDAQLSVNGVPSDLTGKSVYLVVVSEDGGTVLGSATPFMEEVVIIDEDLGKIRYDWTQEQVDAARPGEYELRALVVDSATGAIQQRHPTYRTATVTIRPRVVGYSYVITEDGYPVLTEDGQSIRA